MTSEKISHYCEKALTISKQQGTRDGLTFLIGEKLSLTQITKRMFLCKTKTFN